MALSQIYTAVPGQVITAARWNNEFGNIYTNGTDVAFPATKAVSFAGFTLALDAAGVSTLTSPSTSGFLFTVGVKSGAPSASGSLGSFTSSTFTDTSTPNSSNATLWTGLSVRTPTLTSASLSVTTDDAATVYIEGSPIAGTNETITNPWALFANGKSLVAVEDARTNTVAVPLTVRATTTSAPANDIGTGVLFQAESADEVPSNIGQVSFGFSDKSAGSEDSYFDVALRVAGAALTTCWRYIALGAFKGIFTHSNTADRTYTLPNRSLTIGAGDTYVGPSSTGTGSTAAHEGSVTISANQSLDGIHFYTNFTLDAAKTVTLDNASNRLIICATGTITINGTIDGIGSGGTGPAGGISVDGTIGASGFAQAGGAGGAAQGGNTGGSGGAIYIHSAKVKSGGAGGAGTGGAGVTNTGDGVTIAHPFSIMGGASGGSGGGGLNVGGTGGNGGGSIVLIAPTIVLGAASAIKTSGANGTNGVDHGSSDPGGGGGGGAGNYYAFCQSYTDSGCTFTQSGGSGGTGLNSGFSGGAGAAGIKQINIYA